ncbi:unnamed protein product [Schistocephalus solidus]|uniref:Uncharacterized protein n=1 Tax=Schistocephalus solidus TaxID=70667 RepID=A0A3P7C1M3_SCHSO|nr:unnamed protein product [Schistocephalus solidus]
MLELISKDVGFNFTIQVAKDRNYGSLHTDPDGKEYYDGMVGEVLRGVSIYFRIHINLVLYCCNNTYTVIMWFRSERKSTIKTRR